MGSLGHLQLTSVLRGVLGPALPDEPEADETRTSPTVGVAPGDLRARVLAAGAPPAAADALAPAVELLGPRERAQVVSPLAPAPGADLLRLGSAAARQIDGTTCGSSVLAMLAAAGDPTLAYWLVTGQTVAGHRPVELVELDDDQAGPAGRFGALQVELQRRTNARAVLGALPWPAAFGTPPWGAARVARYPGVTYRAARVDDTHPGDVRAVRARSLRALDHGVPVPVYTGGDLSTGLGTALPRHVVLLTARSTTGVRIYDPSTAGVHDVGIDDLFAPRGPRAAFGGWAHVCWALLPVGH